MVEVVMFSPQKINLQRYSIENNINNIIYPIDIIEIYTTHTLYITYII